MAIGRAKTLIETLGLTAHVEGGYFRRTFAATHRPRLQLPEGERHTMTAILYLLTADSPVGRFHRNRSDIMHFFHEGQAVCYSLIHPDGRLEEHVMGPDVGSSQCLQLAVPGGVWKASRLLDSQPQAYALVGEAVAPGFEYEDMSLADPEALRREFPQHVPVIDSIMEAIASTRGHP